MPSRTLTILGSTGSIGTNTLDVVRQNPDRFQVFALVAGRNIELLARQIEEFRPAGSRRSGSADDWTGSGHFFQKQEIHFRTIERRCCAVYRFP